ncbi:DUF4391 domain-containing protein [Chitinophagaceae bacterium MMS25-I14]
MKTFDLPVSTEINRTIPKNSFDKYASPGQRKRFSELIEKIRWGNKLSYQTINLEGKDMTEIQVFYVELKQKADVSGLLNLIDKAIPYHIVFIVQFNGEYFLRAAAKHAHPNDENIAVIDWVFCSEWMDQDNQPYKIILKVNLDFIWNDFCRQLCGKTNTKMSIEKLIYYEQRISSLTKEIEKLKQAIKTVHQFNRKAEFNIELQAKEERLAVLMNKFE